MVSVRVTKEVMKRNLVVKVHVYSHDVIMLVALTEIIIIGARTMPTNGDSADTINYVN
jgi:hypothetical protein